MMNEQIWRRSQVPGALFRHGRLWAIAVAMVLLGDLPLLHPPMRLPIGGLEISGWCLGLLAIAQAIAYGTDYHRRPFAPRAMAFVGGLLVYVAVLVPAVRWFFALAGPPPTPGAAVSGPIHNDSLCMVPVLAYAFSHSRLLAKPESPPAAR